MSLLALSLALSLGSPPKIWTLVAGGDIMLNGVPSSVKPLAAVGHAFRSADLAIANLEIPLTNSPTRTTRKTPAELRRRAQYILRGDPRHAPHLREVGLDIVSLANNHSMDFGVAGLEEMTRLLRQQGIKFTGTGANVAQARSVVVYRVPGGPRVGLISALAFMNTISLWKCTPATATSPGLAALAFNGTVDARARRELRQWVGGAKAKCDLLIVALHWGIERQTVPSPYQVALGRAAVDAGADFVWGHHPHVLQGGELYRGKPILYSMGNLISPLPAATGLARLTFTGQRISGFDFIPAAIRGGRVRPLGRSGAGAQQQRFAALGRAVRSRYPSAHSRPLP